MMLRGKTQNMTRLSALAVALLLGLQSACDNPFAPAKTAPDTVTDRPPAELATRPEIVMDNLERAFEDRDKELYETLLDERFWFTEDDCAGNLVLQNGREEELDIMGRRDGSQGLLDIFRTIEYDFQLIQRRTELGREFPNAFEGDPDGHPDEDWEVFRGRVTISLLMSADDGFLVEQNMNFKLREGDDSIWRMARWVDDALVGDCGDDGATKSVPIPNEAVKEALSWSQAKRLVLK